MINGIIVVDKPEGWTSQDVCARLRGALHERRVGHSGTLDPMATGVLVVFVGRATRAVEFAESDRKTYIARLRLGIATDTQDTTGNVLSKVDATVSEGQLRDVLGAFRGEIEQVPPMFSAIKIGGRKLYELARRGESVERPPRRVTVYSLDLLGREGEDLVLRVECSKGTYIRTLCDDIGRRLGCGGAMAALRRVRAGAFGIEDAHTLDEVLKRAQEGKLEGVLLPVDSIFRDVPGAVIGPAEEKRCRCGGDFRTGLPDGEYRVYSESGEFLMLGRAEKGNMGTVKSFFTV